MTIPVEFLKTYFLGINLEGKAKDELNLISTLGLENSEIFNINSANLDQIFAKIKMQVVNQR